MGMLKRHRTSTMHDETLKTLAEALMMIVVCPPIRRVGRRKMIVLPTC
jgi:hypothetical protein